MPTICQQHGSMNNVKPQQTAADGIAGIVASHKTPDRRAARSFEMQIYMQMFAVDRASYTTTADVSEQNVDGATTPSRRCGTLVIGAPPRCPLLIKCARHLRRDLHSPPMSAR